MHRRRNRRFSKQPKNPHFIYNGDLCFFKKPQTVFIADQNFDYNDSILRVIWPGEHLVYVKRMRKNRKGPWLHCFESYGLEYVFDGSIKEFTKEHVPYKEGWPNDSTE